MNPQKLDQLVSYMRTVGNTDSGMGKTAKVGDFLKRIRKGLTPQSYTKDLMKDAFRIMGIGAALGGGGALAAHAVGAGVKGVEKRLDYRTSRKRLQQFDPELYSNQRASRQTDTYLNTLNRIAPTLARDPVVSSSFIRRMKQMPETALGMAKELASAESRLQDISGGKLSTKVPYMIPSVGGPSFTGI